MTESAEQLAIQHKNTGLGPDKSQPTQPTPTRPDKPHQPNLELSATQILAGTAAAATAALLGSRLGVAGTILGAAVGSLVSIVAAAVYTHTLATARYRVRTVIHQQDQPQDRRRSPEPAARPQQPRTSPPRDPRPRNPRPRPMLFDRLRRGSTSRRGSLLVGAVAATIVFVTTLGLVTGIETVTGRPLSGGAVGGLTVLGGDRTGAPDVDGTTPSVTGPAASSSGNADSDDSPGASTTEQTESSLRPTPASTNAGDEVAPLSPSPDPETSGSVTSSSPGPTENPSATPASPSSTGPSTTVDTSESPTGPATSPTPEPTGTAPAPTADQDAGATTAPPS